MSQSFVWPGPDDVFQKTVVKRAKEMMKTVVGYRAEDGNMRFIDAQGRTVFRCDGSTWMWLCHEMDEKEQKV